MLSNLSTEIGRPSYHPDVTGVFPPQGNGIVPGCFAQVYELMKRTRPGVSGAEGRRS
jgi:hypothetical protein